MERKYIATVDLCDRDMTMDICHMTGHGKRPLHMTGHGKRPVIYCIYTKYTLGLQLNISYTSVYDSIYCCVDIKAPGLDIQDSSISYRFDIEGYNLRYRRFSA
jgi:hypothetical protein